MLSASCVKVHTGAVGLTVLEEPGGLPDRSAGEISGRLEVADHSSAEGVLGFCRGIDCSMEVFELAQSEGARQQAGGGRLAAAYSLRSRWTASRTMTS